MLDLAALAGVVLLLGLAAGALIARQIARPIRRLDRAARRVAERRPRHRGRGRGQHRAALARPRLQRDDAADQAAAARAAGLRRRRLAPAAHAADRAATAAGEPRRAARRATERPRPSWRPRSARSTGSRRSSTSCWSSAAPASTSCPASAVDLDEAAARAAERWRAHGAKSGEVELDVRGDGVGRRPGARGPTSTARSTRWSRTRCATRRAGSTVTIDAGPGRIEVLDRGPGPRARRGGGGLRALQPRQRRPARAERHRPRPADRPRADPPVGRRRLSRQPRPRRPACCHRGAGTMTLCRDAQMAWPGAARHRRRGRGRDRRQQPRQPADRPLLRTDLGRRRPGAPPRVQDEAQGQAKTQAATRNDHVRTDDARRTGTRNDHPADRNAAAPSRRRLARRRRKPRRRRFRRPRRRRLTRRRAFNR